MKLFTPDAACTWLLTEIDPDDPDIAFGLCDLGLGCPELGSISLSELESLLNAALSANSRMTIRFGSGPPSISSVAPRPMVDAGPGRGVLTIFAGRQPANADEPVRIDPIWGDTLLARAVLSKPAFNAPVRGCDLDRVACRVRSWAARPTPVCIPPPAGTASWPAPRICFWKRWWLVPA